MLGESLSHQTVPYEWILIDNTNHQFRSAASALNHGAQQAKGDIVVFAHQDIRFDTRFLETLSRYLNELPNSLVGVAGSKENLEVVTNIKQGPNHENAGTQTLYEPTEVQTLDEVLIACKKEIFTKLQFDEKTCNDWHLYGVDLCLSAYVLGIPSIVVPMEIYHLSSGKISLGYALTLFKVLLKHRKNFPFIYTSCGTSKTSLYRSVQYVSGLIWDHVIKRG